MTARPAKPVSVTAWPTLPRVVARSYPAGCSSPGERTEQRTLAPLVPADALEATRPAFAASVAASNPIGQRQMMTRFGLGRTQERKLCQSMLADSDGQDSGDGSHS
jgi:hypothetical protein